MQSLMFLDCFVQKLSKKNLWGSVRPPFGKERVKIHVSRCLKENLKFGFGNNEEIEENDWAYLFRLPRDSL